MINTFEISEHFLDFWHNVRRASRSWSPRAPEAAAAEAERAERLSLYFNGWLKLSRERISNVQGLQLKSRSVYGSEPRCKQNV